MPCLRFLQSCSPHTVSCKGNICILQKKLLCFNLCHNCFLGGFFFAEEIEPIHTGDPEENLQVVTVESNEPTTIIVETKSHDYGDTDDSLQIQTPVDDIETELHMEQVDDPIVSPIEETVILTQGVEDGMEEEVDEGIISSTSTGTPSRRLRR